MSEIRETIFRLSGALILLMSSGMHTGWTTFKINIAESWMQNISFFLLVLAHTSWFIGMIIGLSLSMLLLRNLGTKTLERLSISLLLLNGISLTISSDTAEVVATAQIIGGIGAGINLINFITLVSEISLKSHRGRLGYLGMLLFFSGLLIFLFINSYLYYQNDVLFFIGILTIVDSCVSFCFNVTGTKNNPSYVYFQNIVTGNSDSIDCICEDSGQDKLKELILDEQHLSELNIYFNATEPLSGIRKQQMCILLINVINILAYNYMINNVALYVLYIATSNHYEWLVPMLIVFRIIGCILGYIKIDEWGRRKYILISGLGIFLTLLFATISYIIVHDHEFSDNFWIPSVFFVILQLFYGLNSGLQITLASEIFPFKLRQIFIILPEIMKNSIFIGIIFLRFYSTSSMFITTIYVSLVVSTFGTLVATILLYIITPRLENLSLQECVDSFKIKIKRNYCVWVSS